MRNLLLTFLSFSFAVAFTQSCATKDEENIDPGGKSEFADKNELYIEREPTSISTNDANKIATLFKGGTTTRASATFDVTTISDSISDTPLVYVINYGNDNGYVIISASKNTQPILAFSDKGSYVIDTNNPSTDLLKDFKKIVSKAQLCTSDSLRIKYALQWASFEKIPERASTRAIPSEIEQRKAKEREYQESQGYRCLGDLTTAQNFLYANDYDAFIKEMEDCSDPQYDYREVVQIFAKTITQESIGELLQTKWHQYYPFNEEASNGFAGCVPIAIAQISYYHKYPTKYDWDNIAISPIYNKALSDLMNDIWDACDASFMVGGTSSDIYKAKETFDKFRYNVNIIDNVTNNELSSQIKYGNPIYMQGDNGVKGHAWVCDGYRCIKDVVISTLIKKPNDPRFKMVDMSPNGFMIYEANGLKKKTSEAGEYFHMNFGWGGGSDGWYYGFKNNIPSNYIKNQKILTIKKK